MNESGPEARWGGLDLLAWFLVAQLGSGLWYGILGAVWSGGVPEDPSIAFLAAGAVVLWAAYGLGPLFSTTVKGEGPRLELGTWLKGLDVPTGLVIGAFTQFPLVWLLYIPLLWFVDGVPSDQAQDLLDRVNGPVDWLLLFLLTGVMAPIVEEVFFRGMLLRLLLRRWSAPIAVLVQAVLFAAVHVQLLQFPGLLLVGVVSGALAVRTGRLGPSWAMHAGFNWVTLATLAFSA